MWKGQIVERRNFLFFLLLLLIKPEVENLSLFYIEDLREQLFIVEGKYNLEEETNVARS